MIDLLFYSLVGGVFSLVGGLVLLARPKFTHKIIHILISFGAGAFLAAALIDILPEALEMGVEPHLVLASTLVGFLAFFVLERFLMSFRKLGHTDHDHSNHTETLSFLIILGDSIHNFLDGVIIALAYVANPLLGLPTAIAIAAHEVPQEIGDFSILMKLGWPRGKIIMVNLLQSVLTIPGVVLGVYAGQMFQSYLPYLLGATSGVFLYIAASDLIPELHHLAGHKHFVKTVVPLLVSVGLLYFLITGTHGH